MTNIEIREFQADIDFRKNQIKKLMQAQLRKALELKCCPQSNGRQNLRKWVGLILILALTVIGAFALFSPTKGIFYKNDEGWEYCSYFNMFGYTHKL